MSSACYLHKSGLLAEWAGAAAVVVPACGLSTARFQRRAIGVDVAAAVVVASNDGKLGDERFTDELRERVTTPR